MPPVLLGQPRGAAALDQVANLPDGTKVIVEGEAQDIVRRLRNGDPTLGWEGDPNMRVVLAPYLGVRTGQVVHRFQIITLDAVGVPYVALESDTCGPEVIRRLVAADNRRRDPVASAMHAAMKQAADRKRAEDEHLDELADKLGTALSRANSGARRHY